MTQKEDNSSSRGWNHESGGEACLYDVNRRIGDGPLHLLSERGVRA
ncbi:hypothetical protein [Methanofollis liminatans]|nr:hypothetical protein [Methanofollis liminatans]